MGFLVVLFLIVLLKMPNYIFVTLVTLLTHIIVNLERQKHGGQSHWLSGN